MTASMNSPAGPQFAPSVSANQVTGRPGTTPGRWRSAVSQFECETCGQTTRYRHRLAECENCGETYCRQRSNGKYCSDSCRGDAADDAAPASSRLRTERQDARRLAIEAWRRLGEVPADAPHWLRRGLKNGDSR